MSTSKFAISWQAGTSAQLELFSPGEDSEDTYSLRYTAPFRTTIRPPLESLHLGSEELDPIRDKLEALVTTISARGGAPPDGASGEESEENVTLERAKLLGNQLWDMIVSRGDVRAELRVPELFLEMGVDETLLEYPWELMHDGEDFLCLKHFLGRFVNVSNPNPAARERPDPLAPGPLRVLLISVPQPQVREAPKGSGKPAVKYDELRGASSETEAIANTLTAMGDTVQLTDLVGKEATYDKVYTAIKANRYHIVHFNGHAYFNKSSPRLSSLVLFDRDLPAGPIVNFFGARPPALFFMNACETAATQSSGSTWEKRYDIFGLARAFLETGGYLVGSRWKVGDDGAAAFAKQFYESLTDGMPLGRATRDARIACRDASDSSDISWASYLLYGDPRLCFSPVS